MWKKVIAPTALVSAMWLLVSGATTFYINWLYEAHERVLTENVSTIQAAAGMEDVLWRLQTTVLEAAQTDRPDPREEAAALEVGFEQHLQTAERTATTPEEQALVKTIREQFNLFRDRIRRWLDPRAPADPRQPVPPEEVISLARAVAQPCKQLLEINEQLLSTSRKQSAELADTVILARMSLLVAGPLVGLLFGLLVARGLHRSVSQISVTLRDATGALDHTLGQVDLSPSGDLPELQQQVESVAAQIRGVLDELQQARGEVIRAERLAAVGELAAGVAHEIRNPLTSIKLLVQTAAQRYPDRPLNARQLQVIQQEVGRMENTVQSLLDFARPADLQPSLHDLRDTLQRALNLTEGRAKQDGVRFEYRGPREPVWVNGDPGQLHQVFVNLLLNGIEAMPEGGPLRVELQRAAPGVARLTVADEGPGIPAAVMERIFEPFVTSKERGTGLGLAISRRIVQAHQGTIFAANQPQQGARFVLELPLGQPACVSDTPMPDQPASQGPYAHAPGD